MCGIHNVRPLQKLLLLIIYPIPTGHTAVAYIFDGEGYFGLDENNLGDRVEAPHMLVFNDGDHLKVQASSESGTRFMLIAGAPNRETIVSYGPIVMNTEDEIQQAFVDLRNGTFVKAI